LWLPSCRRVLGPEPWNVCYAEPSIRPDDSRYGDNPNRVQRHTQFQVRCHVRHTTAQLAIVVTPSACCTIQLNVHISIVRQCPFPAAVACILNVVTCCCYAARSSSSLTQGTRRSCTWAAWKHWALTRQHTTSGACGGASSSSGRCTRFSRTVDKGAAAAAVAGVVADTKQCGCCTADCDTLSLSSTCVVHAIQEGERPTCNSASLSLSLSLSHTHTSFMHLLVFCGT
jgi:hypothetical protein